MTPGLGKEFEILIAGMSNHSLNCCQKLHIPWQVGPHSISKQLELMNSRLLLWIRKKQQLCMSLICSWIPTPVMLSTSVGSSLCLVLSLLLNTHCSQIFSPCVLLSQFFCFYAKPLHNHAYEEEVSCMLFIPKELHKPIYPVFQRHFH